MKKAAIIFGSPRKDGNTAILVEEARRGLSDSGITSEIFYLNDMNIKGCQACYYCKKNNTTECAIKDDMQQIYKAVDSADGVIIASPIYFGTVTAQMKIWQDRMFPYINMKVGSMMNVGKKAGLIFTQNQPDGNRFVSQINLFKHVTEILGFELKSELLAVDLDKGNKPMVSENISVMKSAYKLGKNLFE